MREKKPVIDRKSSYSAFELKNCCFLIFCTNCTTMYIFENSFWKEVYI